MCEHNWPSVGECIVVGVWGVEDGGNVGSGHTHGAHVSNSTGGAASVEIFENKIFF